ncbi:hypothetical protein FQA39_LY13040 [Lamprigera yunnana]|nr:hypothetical protein FQA39_LY13040 [Lamprigera yunnana]
MRLKINPIAAYGLYKGLLTDSGRFLYSQTSADTFKAAQILINAKADLERIHKLSKKGVGYVVVTKEDISKWSNLTLDEMKYGLGVLQGIKEIKISMLIIEMPEEIKVSLRSRDYAVVEVAQKFNGGGHKLASGAKLEKLSDVKIIVEELERLITKKITSSCLCENNVIAFKPVIDSRYSVNSIASHSGSMLPSFPISSSDDIKKIIERESKKGPIDVIGIDEVQFIDKGVVELINDLANQGIIVIVTGLDKDFKSQPFQNVDVLMPMAEFVDKLTAICHRCGNFANKTQRIIDGVPAK